MFVDVNTQPVFVFSGTRWMNCTSVSPNLDFTFHFIFSGNLNPWKLVQHLHLNVFKFHSSSGSFWTLAHGCTSPEPYAANIIAVQPFSKLMNMKYVLHSAKVCNLYVGENYEVELEVSYTYVNQGIWYLHDSWPKDQWWVDLKWIRCCSSSYISLISHHYGDHRYLVAKRWKKVMY